MDTIFELLNSGILGLHKVALELKHSRGDIHLLRWRVVAHQVAGQAGATPTIQATGETAAMNTIIILMMITRDMIVIV